MSLVERAGLYVLGALDPEWAHWLALRALKCGLAPLPGPISTPRLATRLAGLSLPNPVGLAAGFDKNAIAISALSRAGFGFIELGAATPYPQAGNAKPRLFRLAEDRAVINRLGFNNHGMDIIADHLMQRADGIPVGLNLGANKDSPDWPGDFASVLETCGPFVDFATVNISSPNTEGLRDLQGKDALTRLLADITTHQKRLARPIPVFLKIAPDLSDSDLADVAEVAMASGIDGVIATNTTVARARLKSAQRAQLGGLSGAPLFDQSTRVLARLSRLTQGRMPLIGVGGIGSAQDAYAKIKAGASAVQLYTAMVFDGIALAARIAQGLDALLARDGFATVTEAVGTENDRWQ
jgi:dihydroorotate dehydrogenase